MIKAFLRKILDVVAFIPIQFFKCIWYIIKKIGQLIGAFLELIADLTFFEMVIVVVICIMLLGIATPYFIHKRDDALLKQINARPVSELKEILRDEKSAKLIHDTYGDLHSYILARKSNSSLETLKENKKSQVKNAKAELKAKEKGAKLVKEVVINDTNVIARLNELGAKMDKALELLEKTPTE